MSRSQTSNRHTNSNGSSSCSSSNNGTGGKSKQGSQGHSSSSQSRSGEESERERRGGGHNGGSTKHIPCKFFKHGNCTAGNGCSFSHDISAFVEKPLCKYFLKGNCKYGNKCALSHNTASHSDATNGSGTRQPNSHTQLKSTNNIGGARNGANPSHDSGLNVKIGNGNSNVGRMHPPQPRRNSSIAADSNDGNSALAPTTSTETSVIDSVIGDSGVSGLYSSSPTSTSNIPSSLSSRLEQGGTAPSRLGTLLCTTDNIDINSGNGTFSSDDPSSPGSNRKRGGTIGMRLNVDTWGSGVGTPTSTYSGNISVHNNADSGLHDISHTNTAPQTIPKSTIGNRRGHLNTDMYNMPPYSGLSPQDNKLIDDLSVSHNNAHNSLAGSPFLSGSIPLLDQVRDNIRNSSGSSPTQHTTRSPLPAVSSSSLTRHAFTNVDNSNGGIGSIRSNSFHHHYPQHPLPSMYGSKGVDNTNSLGTDLHDIVTSTDDANTFLRSPNIGISNVHQFYSSSSLSNPISPHQGLSLFTNRQRANTQGTSGQFPQLSPSLGDSARLDSAGTQLGSFSLNRNNENHAVTQSSNIWDFPAFETSPDPSGSGFSRSFHEPHNSYRLSTGNFPLVSQHGVFPSQRSGALGQQLQQHDYSSVSGTAPSRFWTSVPPLPNQFKSKDGFNRVSLGEAGAENNSLGSSKLAPGAPLSNTITAGLGPNTKTNWQSQRRSFAGAIGSPLETGGTNQPTDSISNTSICTPGSMSAVIGRNSRDGSSISSDTDGELFELEQDSSHPQMPTEQSVAPSPSFISINGFANKLSGLSLHNIDNAGTGAPVSAQPLQEISAISRPKNF